MAPHSCGAFGVIGSPPARAALYKEVFPMPSMDYSTWMNRVEQKVDCISGVGLSDLPQELNYHELYNDGLTVGAAARETLERAGFYSFAF